MTLLSVLVVCLALALATVKFARAQPTAPEEIIPTTEQQQPIKDLLADQARTNQGYQDKIDGAVRMLMATMKDPTGKTGLDPKEWVAQADGKGGLKIITMKSAQEQAKKAQQGTAGQ